MDQANLKSVPSSLSLSGRKFIHLFASRALDLLAIIARAAGAASAPVDRFVMCGGEETITISAHTIGMADANQHLSCCLTPPPPPPPPPAYKDAL